MPYPLAACRPKGGGPPLVDIGTTIVEKKATSLFPAGLHVSNTYGWTAGRTCTVPRGAQVGGNFYANCDSNQGSIAVWITPDWAGNDGKRHVLLQWSANAFLVKDAANDLVLSVASGVTCSVSAAAWSAATRYHVIVRWDADNPIDGSNNHLCISVNDSHTFARTTDYTPEAPAATIYMGTDTSGLHAANAILEGITVNREVWWDGAAGINVHFGIDTVAQNYDKTSTNIPSTYSHGKAQGPWGTVLCVPTNAAVAMIRPAVRNREETLSVGTWMEQAWTHPHSLNLLGGAAAKGYLFDGTYTNDGLAAVGSPTVAALAEGEKIFAGGYKSTGTSSDYIEWSFTGLTAGASYVIRAMANGDGTAKPQLAIYDTTNSAEIMHLDGTTTSTRQQPDVLMFSFCLPTAARGASANCTAIKVQLRNAVAGSGTVYWHQAELQANLLDAPSFETGAAADPWLPDGWTDGSSLAAGQSIKGTGRTGYCFELTCFNADHKGTYMPELHGTNALADPFAIGGWFKMGVNEAADFYLRDEFGRMVPQSSGGGIALFQIYVQGDEQPLGWFHSAVVCMRDYDDNLTLHLRLFGAPGPTAGYFDDLYAFRLTAVTLTVA